MALTGVGPQPSPEYDGRRCGLGKRRHAGHPILDPRNIVVDIPKLPAAPEQNGAVKESSSTVGDMLDAGIQECANVTVDAAGHVIGSLLDGFRGPVESLSWFGVTPVDARDGTTNARAMTVGI
jgi:hypothetical protein